MQFVTIAASGEVEVQALPRAGVEDHRRGGAGEELLADCEADAAVLDGWVRGLSS